MFQALVLACLATNPNICQTLEDLYGPYETKKECTTRAYEIAVELPEYWFKLVGDDYTISITPHGPYHVWVDEKLEDGFFVESSSETDVEFDWVVIGGIKDATIPEVEPQAP